MASWRYAIIQEGDYFEVVEEYLDDDGWHEAWCEADYSAESPELLLQQLKNMASDLEEAIDNGRIIEAGIK